MVSSLTTPTLFVKSAAVEIITCGEENMQNQMETQ